MNGSILIFGLPRSGTTWIGKLFDSHPDTLYRHEPDSVHRLAMPMFPDPGDAERYRQLLEKFMATLPGMRSLKIVGKQPLFPKTYQSGIALAAYRVSTALAKTAGRVFPDVLVPYTPVATGYERRRLIWKSIESLGRLGVCLEALPGVRAMHILRHPCGYAASVLRGEADHRFAGNTPTSEDYGIFEMLLATAPARDRHLTLDELKALTPGERLAWLWVLTQEKVLADSSGSKDALLIRYEDICAHPLSETRRMFEFAGLSWDDQTETFISASTTEAQRDYYSVFKNPAISARRWRSELAPQTIEKILRILQSSPMRQFYDRDSPVQQLA